MRRRLRLAASTVLLAACAGPPSGPGAGPGDRLVNTNPALAIPDTAAIAAIAPGPRECDGLAERLLDEPSLAHRLVVSATEYIDAADALPAHCRMRGELDHRTGTDGQPYHIGFELRLPAQWSGRFLFQGGGGTDGVVSPAIGAAGSGPSALARGYAVVSTDAGHQGRGPEFGLDPQARTDYAYRALGEVTEAAHTIIAGHYARPVERSYIQGCSNGGRQAMIAAQRFPHLFDGAIAGNPGFRLTSAAAAEAFNTQAFNAIAPRDAQDRPITSAALTREDLTLVSNAVLKACDALDGLEDGLINDVKACQFDPATLVCAPSASGDCLSRNKVDALAAVMAGPRLPSGEVIYGPFPWDAGLGANGWRMWMLGSSPTGQNNSMNATLGFGAIRYYFLTPPNPDYDPTTFDAARDWPVMQETRVINDADGPIDAFAAKGGKLLIYHGVSDPVFSAADSMMWIDALPQGSDAYARLFLVPGMNHCAGGPATDRFDALAALENWVERGEAPDRIIATGASFPGAERPLCSYPEAARYTGGDPSSAASFTCRR